MQNYLRRRSVVGSLARWGRTGSVGSAETGQGFRTAENGFRSAGNGQGFR